MLPVDVVIVGGGVAGLWTLALAVASGRRAVLVERDALGAGQTIAAQGIVHGGLKYALDGRSDRSADAIRSLPERWREALAGRSTPDLSATTLRACACHLWTTGSLKSRLSLFGAQLGLRVSPSAIARAERPPPLRDCGDVLRLDEQVVDPASLVAALAAPHAQRLCKGAIELDATGAGRVARVSVAGQVLSPKNVVLTAGEGNAALREAVGLAPAMQRRPLHMVLLRGPLPELNGHCIDGLQTRLTITTARLDGRNVWQIGGRLAEDGVALDRAALLARARDELRATLPGLALDGVEGTTQRIDRAEAAAGGRRPPDCFAEREGNVITGWPTKMVLAPTLAARIVALLDPPGDGPMPSLAGPRPSVARPPWEGEDEWIPVG